MEFKKLSVKALYKKMAKIGLEGWIDWTEGEVLRREIERVPEGGIYVEIGVAYGKSLSTVCYYAKERVDIFGIDVLNWEKERKKNMEKLGVGGRAIFIQGDSQQEALKWPLGKEIDLLFIDGDHTYYGVLMDLLSWVPHVKHGGRIMLHDYDETSPGVMRAVHDFIFPHNAYDDFSPNFHKPDSVTIFTFTKR